ncbi:MAG: hypothetical protein HN731_12105, partial [Rhodospirillaceae bacterium]|nr:hypothetical protein [Rhodospirillaceae bacterium]
AGTDGWDMLHQLIATASAPTFFPAFQHPDGREYVDGAIVANNPSKIAVTEARNLFPHRQIGCIISLGAGKPLSKPRDLPFGQLFKAGMLWTDDIDT